MLLYGFGVGSNEDGPSGCGRGLRIELVEFTREWAFERLALVEVGNPGGALPNGVTGLVSRMGAPFQMLETECKRCEGTPVGLRGSCHASVRSSGVRTAW